MEVRLGDRKLVKHHEEPGHVRELTLSCYRRMPLLTNDAWRVILDWKWSSARWNADLTKDSSLPKLTSLPPHFFDSVG